MLDDFYSMNAFEPLFWMGAAYVVIRILKTGNAKLWLLFGAIVGLGLQNKHSMAFFVLALVVGLSLTHERKHLVNKWFWLGGAVAGLLFLPNILWEVAHGWPTLEFMQNAQQWKNLPMSPVQFLTMLSIFHHPFALPLWVGGVLALLLQRNLKAFRLFGIAFLVLLVLFIVQRGKPYYISPFFPLVLASGAVAFDEYIRNRSWKWLLPAYGVLLIVGGLIMLPLSLPLLPLESYIRYSETLGLTSVKMEKHGDTRLPQVLADRFGWREMVAEVAQVYRSLTPEEQAKAAIYAQNYGQASAVDFYGREYGLPLALCGHNNYWLWGTRGYSGEVLIIIGGRIEDHRKAYDSVEQVGIHKNDYAMPHETDLPIFVCRNLKMPMENVCKLTKRYS
jgi:4-amino-4-deoxy-L-arabinose transferase-like glycosyltransferase